MREIKQPKKCKVCSKGLGFQNKSGYCTLHFITFYQKKLREERKKNGLCIICGKETKPVNPIRCPICLKQNYESSKKSKLKKNLKTKEI